MKRTILFTLMSIGVLSTSPLQAENLTPAQECLQQTEKTGNCKTCYDSFHANIHYNNNTKYVGCAYINSSCFNTFETFGEQIGLPPCPLHGQVGRVTQSKHT